MSCYAEFLHLYQQAYDQMALDALIEKYGSEVYIAAMAAIELHGSRFEFIGRLLELAAEEIDWNNPPIVLAELLRATDYAGILDSGDVVACRSLCCAVARQVVNTPYRLALLATIGYYLAQLENTHNLEARLAEDYLETLRHAEITD